MTTARATTSTESRDLILTRVIEAPPEKVFRPWMEPELFKQWFAPSPWKSAPHIAWLLFASSSIRRKPSCRSGYNDRIILRVGLSQTLTTKITEIHEGF